MKQVLSHTTAIPFKIKASKFYCAYCYPDLKSFEKPSDLRAHTTLHDDEIHDHVDRILRPQFQNEILRVDVSEFSCKVCNTPIDTWNDMFQHLADSHDIPFDQSYTRLIPYNLHSDLKLYCALCETEFQNFLFLDAHMNAHYANYMCSDCGDIFLAEARLKHHQLIHNTGRYPCNYCGKIFSLEKYKKKHEAMVHGESKLFKCDCGEQFHKEYERHLHIVEKHPERIRVNTCEFCGKSFDWRPYYLSHLRKAHSKVKKNACRYCNKRFVTKHEAVTHEMRHTGDGKHLCVFCGKKFVTSAELRNHSKRHVNEIQVIKTESGEFEEVEVFVTRDNNG